MAETITAIDIAKGNIPGGKTLEEFIAAGGRVVNSSVFDPGLDERETAIAGQQDLEAEYNAGPGVPLAENDTLLFSDPETGAVYEPGAIRGYREGDPFAITDEMRVENKVGRDESAWNDMNVPTLGRDAQVGALGYFGNIAMGGPDAVANAEYERRRQEAEQLARGQRESAIQKAEMQGQGTGGAALLADITGGQAAAQSANMAGTQAAADMQTRRDAAASYGSDVANTLRGADFGEASQTANAADQWSQWWQQAQQGVDTFNAGQETDAALTNYDRRIGVQDANTDMFNKLGEYNQQGDQRAFDNWLRYMQGKSGAVAGTTGALHFDAQNEPSVFEPIGDAVEFGGNVATGARRFKNL